MESKSEATRSYFFQQQPLFPLTSTPEIKHVIFDISGGVLNFKPHAVKALTATLAAYDIIF